MHRPPDDRSKDDVRDYGGRQNRPQYQSFLWIQLCFEAKHGILNDSLPIGLLTSITHRVDTLGSQRNNSKTLS
ncbi:MAG: hypothetical protein NVS9B5_12670 [Terriglobales bacterium]